MPPVLPPKWMDEGPGRDDSDDKPQYASGKTVVVITIALYLATFLIGLVRIESSYVLYYPGVLAHLPLHSPQSTAIHELIDNINRIEPSLLQPFQGSQMISTLLVT